MNLYKFDPETGKYLETKEAEVDTWQSQIKGSTAYKGEPNATFLVPTFQEGYTPYLIGGEWVNMPNTTLEETKAAKLKEINAACDAILNAAVASYPESEVLTFDQQVEEVKAYQASGNVDDCPLLYALAVARGITLNDLIERVIAKRQAFSVLSGYVIGQRQRLEDTLDTLETVEAVEALVVDIEPPIPFETEASHD